MDDLRFDALTKSLAGGLTRRRILAGVAAVATVLRAVPAGAVTKRRRGEICRKDGECASGVCGPKDAPGRQRCQAGTGDGCAEPSECGGGQCLEGICCSAADLCEGGCCSPGRAPTETCCLGT